MKKIIAGAVLPFIAFILIAVFVPAGAAKAKNQPRQDVKWEKLFQISRSKNANIVVYEAAMVRPGPGLSPVFLEKDPIKVYWVLKADKGQVQDLKFVEKPAYGVDVNSVKLDRLDFVVKPLPKRPIKVEFRKVHGGLVPAAITAINGEDCFISEIYINSKDAFPKPKVLYIDMKGISLATGNEVTERINNK